MSVSTSSAKLFLQELSRSKIYQDYESAFCETTGMPLALQSADTWSAALHDRKRGNAFCTLMGEFSRSCAACLEVQQKISDPTSQRAVTAACFAGFYDTAVPVRSGDNLIGFLYTGQVALRQPSREKFNRVARQLMDWGVSVDSKKLEEFYFDTRTLAPKQYYSALKLLEVFALHLSMVANQILLQKENAESPRIKKAKEYIQEHKFENISLGDVAKVINVSSFYFCKIFRKSTGLNFTDYLSRVRVEKAKNLLLNPNQRISEIAYEVGFQSLTHFNRVFLKITGHSPSSYRKTLPAI